MPKSFFLSAEIHAYLVEHGTPPDAVQQRLIEETAKLGGISMMQIAPEQGAFMTLLARAIGAKRAIEVGTFTGYSALVPRARAARRRRGSSAATSRESGPRSAASTGRRRASRTRSSCGSRPAADTLRALPREPLFDLAFIDADKTGYHDLLRGDPARCCARAA